MLPCPTAIMKPTSWIPLITRFRPSFTLSLTCSLSPLKELDCAVATAENAMSVVSSMVVAMMCFREFIFFLCLKIIVFNFLLLENSFRKISSEYNTVILVAGGINSNPIP